MPLTAQQRISLNLGSAIVDIEMLRDQVAALTAQVAERDETIKKLQESLTFKEQQVA